jgi:four helix bundle protein
MTTKSNTKNDYLFLEQFHRTSVLIMNNIAERFERNINNEFLRFITSAGEVRSLLYVVLDLGYITESEFKDHFKTSIYITTPTANFNKCLDKTKR